ncbi:MAG: segregation/condensation protein A [Spirochaetes bacterium]|nr:segregation/condensation protein A [Spirochaetota bacterium]
MLEISKEDISGEKSNNYILNIENFEGPLDLLWDLIKKAKIDITEIFIAQITEQYLEYLKLMEKMNVKIASEFILMASDLLYYKSRALLPSEDIEDEYFVPPLPPDLVAKLLEYKKFQLTSLKLKNYYENYADVFNRNNEIRKIDCEDGEEYIGVTLYELLDAFARILNKKEDIIRKEIVFDEILVSDMIDLIASMLEKESNIFFSDLFSDNPRRLELIVTFMAILEMAKHGKIKLLQHKVFGDIKILRV